MGSRCALTGTLRLHVIASERNAIGVEWPISELGSRKAASYSSALDRVVVVVHVLWWVLLDHAPATRRAGKVRRRTSLPVCRRSTNNGTGTRQKAEYGCGSNERLQIGFAESHAAAVKHTVITIEKTIGRIKRYLQLTTVMAAKQRAKAHTVTRMTAKVSAGRPPSCHANTAANR